MDGKTGKTHYLIELYDNDALENVISLEKGGYDGVALFYFRGHEPSVRRRNIIMQVVSERFGTEPVFVEVSEKGVDEAAEAIGSYIGKLAGRSFTIDLTGGDAVFIAAAGKIAALNSQKDGEAAADIELCRTDAFTGGIDILTGPDPAGGGNNGSRQGGRIGERNGFRLTFSDVIKLNGGSVIGKWPENFDRLGIRQYEIIRMWNAIKDIPADWNRFCSISYANNPGFDDNGFIVRRFSRSGEKVTAERVMSRLRKRGIVSRYEIGTDRVRYCLHESAKTAELYVAAGTALEMYTALAASGTGLFRECYTKVVLDYDGIVSGRDADPTNEIDVTMMYGAIPVFVSCKNTEPTKEYMYEINTMASHFGGKYAVPALVSSRPAMEPVRERAREMNLILIDDVQSLTLKEFRSEIVKKIRNTIPVIARNIT